MPTSAFKSLRLAAAEPREVFRSSGTTRGAERRSVHHHPYPDLYRAVIDATFPAACLPARSLDRRGHSRADDGARQGRRRRRRESRNTGEGDGAMSAPAAAGGLPILSLIPDRAAAPDSSLSFMAAHVFRAPRRARQRLGGPGSRHRPGPGLPLAGGPLDNGRAGADPGNRPGPRPPARPPGGTWPAAPAAAGIRFLPLPRARPPRPVPTRLDRGAPFPLRVRPAPQDVQSGCRPGSRVFETGGFKGRRMATTPEDVRRRARNLLGLDRQAIVREYGMTELTSQAYSPARRRAGCARRRGCRSACSTRTRSKKSRMARPGCWLSSTSPISAPSATS